MNDLPAIDPYIQQVRKMIFGRHRMGYHSINKAEITRTAGDKRTIEARVFCSELDAWESKEFEYHRLDEALKWVQDKMNELSM